MVEWGKGKYGRPGGELITEAFDRWLVGQFFVSDPQSDRGFEARLRYVLEHTGGGEALHDAGVMARSERIVGWLTGDVRATRKTRAAVDQAYRRMRTRNSIRSLRRSLNSPRRVTVEPIDPSRVPPTHRVQYTRLSDREVTIRPGTWQSFISAWEADDEEGMQAIWEDVCDDIDSPPAQWFEVSHIGFSI